MAQDSYAEEDSTVLLAWLDTEHPQGPAESAMLAVDEQWWSKEPATSALKERLVRDGWLPVARREGNIYFAGLASIRGWASSTCTPSQSSDQQSCITVEEVPAEATPEDHGSAAQDSMAARLTGAAAARADGGAGGPVWRPRLVLVSKMVLAAASVALVTVIVGPLCLTMLLFTCIVVVMGSYLVLPPGTSSQLIGRTYQLVSTGASILLATVATGAVALLAAMARKAAGSVASAVAGAVASASGTVSAILSLLILAAGIVAAEPTAPSYVSSSHVQFISVMSVILAVGMVVGMLCAGFRLYANPGNNLAKAPDSTTDHGGSHKAGNGSQQAGGTMTLTDGASGVSPVPSANAAMQDTQHIATRNTAQTLAMAGCSGGTAVRPGTRGKRPRCATAGCRYVDLSAQNPSSQQQNGCTSKVTPKRAGGVYLAFTGSCQSTDQQQNPASPSSSAHMNVGLDCCWHDGRLCLDVLHIRSNTQCNQQHLLALPVAAKLDVAAFCPDVDSPLEVEGDFAPRVLERHGLPNKELQLVTLDPKSRRRAVPDNSTNYAQARTIKLVRSVRNTCLAGLLLDDQATGMEYEGKNQQHGQLVFHCTGAEGPLHIRAQAMVEICVVRFPVLVLQLHRYVAFVIATVSKSIIRQFPEVAVDAKVAVDAIVEPQADTVHPDGGSGHESSPGPGSAESPGAGGSRSEESVPHTLRIAEGDMSELWGHDVFISYSGNEEDFARSMRRHLHGDLHLKVFHATYTLQGMFDNDRIMMAEAARCPVGLVLLSPSFFDRDWPLRELATIVKCKAMLPALVGMSFEDVKVRLKEKPQAAECSGSEWEQLAHTLRYTTAVIMGSDSDQFRHEIGYLVTQRCYTRCDLDWEEGRGRTAHAQQFRDRVLKACKNIQDDPLLRGIQYQAAKSWASSLDHFNGKACACPAKTVVVGRPTSSST